MSFFQLLKFALGGLWRQKVRTALTLVGVTVGACALAFSSALGLGLRAFVDTEFKSRDDFWWVSVCVDQPQPDESGVPPEKIAVAGQMSDERRERIREALLEDYQSGRPAKPPKLLTREALAALAALPDVREVRAFRTSVGHLWVDGGERPFWLDAASGPLEDLTPRLIAGRLPAGPDADEIVVSEFALYQLGFRDDVDLERVLGRPAKLVVGGVYNAPPLALAQALGRPTDELTRTQTQALEKLTRELPAKIDAFDLSAAERAELRKLLELPKNERDERPFESARTATGTYRVCGVVRLLTREDRKKRTPLDSWGLTNGSAFLPPGTGDRLTGALSWELNGGLFNADVRVRPGGDLPGTVDRIEAMGFHAFPFLDEKRFAAAKRQVTLIAAGLNLFALIALVVAAVGITNTLVASVVERTREIGILRAVGATRRQVMGLFLFEGALIGLAGAALGLGLARGLAAAGDDWVHGLIRAQMNESQTHSTTIFVFPWWLWAGSAGFAIGVSTLAALYPARRAAKIHPIEALRCG